MVAGVHTFIHKDISVDYDFQNTNPPTMQHWILFSLHYNYSGGPIVGHVHDGPHAGLHLVPPPDHPRSHTASVPALNTAGQQLPRPGWNIQQSSERSSLLTCSYREKSFWISFWKSFSLISDFSPCRTASKSWYLQLELQKHYRTFCTSFAQSGIKVQWILVVLEKKQ